MFRRMLPRLIAIFCCCQICVGQAISPVLIAQWPESIRIWPTALTFDGSLLYVTTPLGVMVLNISNPARMRPVTMLDRSPSRQVTSLVPGKLILQEISAKSLRVLNVEDILEPIDIETVPNSVPGSSPAVSWPYVYTGGTNITVWDFTDPVHPVSIRSFPANSVRLFAHGNVLVSLNGNNQLQFDFFDITDRSAPRWMGRASNIATQQIAFDDNLAYLAGSTVQVVDLSVTSELKIIGTFPGPGSAPIAARNGIVAVFRDRDVTIIDATNLSQPQAIGLIHTRVTGSPLIAFHNDRLFISDGCELSCYDMTDPRHPNLVGTFPVGAVASKLVKNGNRLFVQQDGDGIQILDITNPGNPVPIQTRLPKAVSMDVVGENVFLVDSQSNFQIYNAANPADPQLLGSLPIQSRSFALAAVGHLAFIDDSNTLRIIDVSTPSAPRVRTNVGGAPFLWIDELTHVGDLVYAFGTLRTNIGYWGLLKIIDAQTGEVVSDVQTEAGSHGAFSVAGSAVYINRSIYDCSDPRNPVRRGELPIQYVLIGRAAFVPGTPNRLFVTTSNSIKEFDLSNPFSPLPLSSYPGWGDGLLANGDFLYVTRFGSVATFRVFGEAPTIPSLNVSLFGDVHLIKWPKRFANYTLLNAPTPSGPWTRNDRAVLVSQADDDYEVFVPSRNSGAFYKLER
jgi:hypothetical protein